MNNEKVIVLGIDGASIELINRFKKNLPNFNRILNEGSSSILESTIPVLTPPAWTSLTSGVNPGKHGVYDFQSFSDGSLISSKDIKFMRIWDILTHAGKKSIVINVPITYPPTETQGLMISGLLTPDTNTNFTYPKSLKNSILEKGYKIGIKPQIIYKCFFNEKHEDLLCLVKDYENIKTDVLTSFLVNHIDWCFSMIVFQELDKIQHFFWNNTSFLMEVYRIYDEILSRIIETCEKFDSHLILVSDHGFKKVDNLVFINKILENESLLKTSESNKTSFIYNYIINKFNKYGSNLLNTIVGRAPTKFKNFMVNSLIGTKKIDHVNSSMTYGFSTGPHAPIKINPDLNESFRKEIEDVFLDYRHNGLKIFEKILHRDEIYHGRYLKHAPDYVLILREGYTAHPSISELHPEIARVSEVRPWMRRYADHHEDTICIIHKSAEKISFKNNASIMDVAPTVYKLLSIDHSLNLDGKSLL